MLRVQKTKRKVAFESMHKATNRDKLSTLIEARESAPSSPQSTFLTKESFTFPHPALWCCIQNDHIIAMKSRNLNTVSLLLQSLDHLDRKQTLIADTREMQVKLLKHCVNLLRRNIFICQVILLVHCTGDQAAYRVNKKIEGIDGMYKLSMCATETAIDA